MPDEEMTTPPALLPSMVGRTILSLVHSIRLGSPRYFWPFWRFVPRSSLIKSPEGEDHVFVVKAGRLEARAVRVLGYTDDRAAVEGVEPGEDVVWNTFLGWARLSSGEKVEAVR